MTIYRKEIIDGTVYSFDSKGKPIFKREILTTKSKRDAKKVLAKSDSKQS